MGNLCISLENNLYFIPYISRIFSELASKLNILNIVNFLEAPSEDKLPLLIGELKKPQIKLRYHLFISSFEECKNTLSITYFYAYLSDVLSKFLELVEINENDLKEIFRIRLNDLYNNNNYKELEDNSLLFIIHLSIFIMSICKLIPIICNYCTDPVSEDKNLFTSTILSKISEGKSEMFQPFKSFLLIKLFENLQLKTKKDFDAFIKVHTHLKQYHIFNEFIKFNSEEDLKSNLFDLIFKIFIMDKNKWAIDFIKYYVTPPSSLNEGGNILESLNPLKDCYCLSWLYFNNLNDFSILNESWNIINFYQQLFYELNMQINDEEAKSLTLKNLIKQSPNSQRMEKSFENFITSWNKIKSIKDKINDEKLEEVFLNSSCFNIMRQEILEEEEEDVSIYNFIIKYLFELHMKYLERLEGKEFRNVYNFEYKNILLCKMNNFFNIEINPNEYYQIDYKNCGKFVFNFENIELMIFKQVGNLKRIKLSDIPKVKYLSEINISFPLINQLMQIPQEEKASPNVRETIKFIIDSVDDFNQVREFMNLLSKALSSALNSIKKFDFYLSHKYLKEFMIETTQETSEFNNILSKIGSINLRSLKCFYEELELNFFEKFFVKQKNRSLIARDKNIDNFEKELSQRENKLTFDLNAFIEALKFCTVRYYLYGSLNLYQCPLEKLIYQDHLYQKTYPIKKINEVLTKIKEYFGKAFQLYDIRLKHIPALYEVFLSIKAKLAKGKSINKNKQGQKPPSKINKAPRI